MYLTQTINNSSLQNITNYIFRRDIDDEETTAADSTIHMQPSLESDCEPVSLEGFLQCRMGKSSGHSSLIWKRKFVYFSFADGGSITVYKDSPNFDVNKIEDSGVLRSVYNKLSRNGVHKGHRNVDYDITPDLPWIAKDVERDSATFVVEIPTSDDDILSIDDVSVSATTVKSTGTVTILRHDDLELESDDDDDKSEDDDSVRGYLITSSTADCDDSGVVDYNEMQKHESFSEDGGKTGSRHDLRKEMATAKTKGKPLRIYFRCEKGSNEKALWLRAFATFGRLSSEYRKQRGIINALTAPLHLNSSNARIRSKENAFLARDTRNLDLTDSPEDAPEADITSVEQLVLGKNPTLARDKEFRVIPAYAYPHRWMTLSEMREEMVLSSEHFHDLRVPDCTGKVIGSLKVEVLQCLGLPKLDRARETDAVVYLVCGEYSFCTDVIPNRQNPMWLRKSRRACNIPIFHGYASLYVGVFDYEPKKAKDEFAGRVEINLSKLRPGSVYDVTLPLRLSKHVYSRRKRGAIRLRFSLNWKSERDVLMSYIPRKIRIPLPQNTTFRHDVSVRCTDPKAFRNIAITVHGSHLPGRFTFVQMRAAIREINFTRKYVLTSIRQNFGELRRWQHPALSAYVFFSWMHCIYANQFSLAPAYTVLFFLIILMCNYMKYNTDEPGQDGFIPPSWEEMFMALLRGHEPGCRNIEPLELIPRKCNVKKKSSNSINEKFGDVNVSTHTPKGKDFMKFLGLIPTKPRNADEEHLEFPFANGSDYPKFSIKECLAHRKGDVDGAAFVNQDPGGEFLGCNDIRGNNLSRFSIDMDLHDLRRKDSSGTKEYDEEEMNFNAAKAVLAKGKRAKSKLSKTATAFGNKTGLNSFIVNPLQTGIDVSVSRVNYISNHMVHSTKAITGSNGSVNISANIGASSRALMQSVIDPLHAWNSTDSSKREALRDVGNDSHLTNAPCGMSSSSDIDLDSNLCYSFDASFDDADEQADDIDTTLLLPEQNIDVEGKNSGKKLTEDLDDIKDKMHEVTWHLFDDQAYVIKNSNTIYFGDGKKAEKKRKSDVKKQLDKYLGLRQYSHTNPFVARVGMYVEPIIGSSYSFLCLFRAGFNVLTWQDPIMTFWLSLFCGVLVIILFIFPWRLFFFVVGVFVVGPQNWVIRILRDRGHLPLAPKYKGMSNKHLLFSEEINELPKDAPIFTSEDRRPGNEPRNAKPLSDDPREIHHVVVPYTPLKYQRCYDWPPEAQYAQVKRELPSEEKKKAPNKDLPASQHKSRNVTTNDTSKAQNQQRAGLRSRFRRRNAAENTLDRPPHSPNRRRMSLESSFLSD